MTNVERVMRNEEMIFTCGGFPPPKKIHVASSKSSGTAAVTCLASEGKAREENFLAVTREKEPHVKQSLHQGASKEGPACCRVGERGANKAEGGLEGQAKASCLISTGAGDCVNGS